jgi:hypothetical protein
MAAALNTMMTCTALLTRLALLVQLEEKKERAAEVIFRIFDSDRAAGASDAAMTAAPAPIVATTAAVDIKGNTPSSSGPPLRAVRRTIVQEDGSFSYFWNFMLQRKITVVIGT